MTRRRSLIAAFTAALVALAAFALIAADAQAAKTKKKQYRSPRVIDAGVVQEAGGSTDAASATDAAAARWADVTRPAPRASSSSPGCYYGQTVDATGRVRCLAPEELTPPRLVHVNSSALAALLPLDASVQADGGLDPDAMTDASASDVDLDASDDAADGADGGADSEGPYKVRVARLSFENGVVSGAMQTIENKTDAMVECLINEGGLRTESARLKLLFLVRPAKRAEGMIVASARNIPLPVVRCIKDLLHHKHIGTPSNDPVGVTLLLELKKNE